MKNMEFKRDIIQAIFKNNHYTPKLIKACEQAVLRYTDTNTVYIEEDNIEWIIYIGIIPQISLYISGSKDGVDEPIIFTIDFDERGEIINATAEG